MNYQYDDETEGVKRSGRCLYHVKPWVADEGKGVVCASLVPSPRTASLTSVSLSGRARDGDELEFRVVRHLSEYVQ